MPDTSGGSSCGRRSRRRRPRRSAGRLPSISCPRCLSTTFRKYRTSSLSTRAGSRPSARMIASIRASTVGGGSCMRRSRSSGESNSAKPCTTTRSYRSRSMLRFFMSGSGILSKAIPRPETSRTAQARRDPSLPAKANLRATAFLFVSNVRDLLGQINTPNGSAENMHFDLGFLVDQRRFELLTSPVRGVRSTN